MTGKEKTFFRMCIKLVLCGQWTVKEVMDLVQDMISYDECIVYLRSWERLGLYTSTWMTYTGWFSGNLYRSENQTREINKGCYGEVDRFLKERRNRMKQSFKKGFGVTLGTLTANLLFTIAAKLAAEKLRNSSLEGEAKPEEES